MAWKVIRGKGMKQRESAGEGEEEGAGRGGKEELV